MSKRASWLRQATAVFRSSCSSGQRVLGPRPDDPVGARQALGRREGRARVDDDRVPADQLRGGAERLGGVDGAEDDEPRRRPVHLGVDPVALALEQAVPLDVRGERGQLRRPVADGLARVEEDEQLGSRVLALEHREADRALLVRDDLEQPLAQRRVEPVDPDVDLAAAGEADLERLVVGDPVGEQPRLARRRAPRARRCRRRSRRSRRTRSPRARRVSETTNFEPTGRGAESRVATTVATATSFPSPRQR